MSSPCNRQDVEVTVNHKSLYEALRWIIPSTSFAGCRTGVKTLWKARMLAFTAVFWVWSDETTLKKRFDSARKLACKMWRWQNGPGTSYQGFIKALHKWTERLFAIILPLLRERMEQVAGASWTVAGWIVFGVDGSRVETPRTRANETRFHSTKKRKKKVRARKGKAPRPTKKAGRKAKQAAKQKQSNKKKTSDTSKKQVAGPQIWLTLFWHVGLGLPWGWKTGPVDSSERAHMLEMLGILPENSMIVADAGFTGYDNWQAVMDAGHSFVIRVGANVKLLKKLGYARECGDRVYLWPDRVRKRSQPPMVLRLITVHNGKHPVHLVTNVLNKTKLSDRAAVKIYKARWGIEVFFRSLKQTFGRRKLRSTSPDNALLELDWSLVGLWAVYLMAVAQAIGRGESPHRVSVAGALDAVRTTMRDYRWRPEPGEDLWSLLGGALLDTYVRRGSKTSRNYPRKKQERPAGKPVIQLASREQVGHAKELRARRQEKRLSA
jgi:hypothetical protein